MRCGVGNIDARSGLQVCSPSWRTSRSVDTAWAVASRNADVACTMQPRTRRNPRGRTLRDGYACVLRAGLTPAVSLVGEDVDESEVSRVAGAACRGCCGGEWPLHDVFFVSPPLNDIAPLICRAV